MTEDAMPIIVKKYANRRLYNTGTSTYVTLDDLAEMVKKQEDFVVYDAKTGEDITRSVLAQIIFEQESRGQNMLPIAFMRQLIRFYGDSMQAVVPSYLEYSMDSLAREQEKLRGHIARTLSTEALDALEDQVRRNVGMFERSMRMFTPFKAEETVVHSRDDDSPTRKDELVEMRQQLQEMQRQIDTLTKKSGN